MTFSNRTFENELSTQLGLSEHLARRALDAFDAGDAEAFKYSTDIHDATQLRITMLGEALDSFSNAMEDPANAHRASRHPVGAIALDLMVQTVELKAVTVT